MIELTIPLEPVAKARSRTAFKNGKVRSYTPERTQVAQDFIRLFLQPYKDQCFPEHTPVKLTAVFYRSKSKWLAKKETKPFRKPDLDNFVKLLLDGINETLVPDDAQITSMSISKVWANGDKPRIWIKLEEDET